MRLGFFLAAVCIIGVASSLEAKGLSDDQPKPQRPNIVIILADDLGYGDPQCYNAESKIPTPSIDRLASEGLRFTDAHTPSSVCTPTRYGLLTGRYCWRTDLKKSVLWPWDEPLIEANRLTLPAMLKTHGYHTACVGKWHLGWDWATSDGTRITDTVRSGQYDTKRRVAFGEKVDFTRPIGGGPCERGFDLYFGDDVPNFPPYCFIENDRTVGIPAVPKPKTMFGHPGPSVPDWDLTAVMPALASRAAEYIRQRANASDGEPFFLYMPLTAPHTPIAPTEPFRGSSQAGLYGDFVHEVDATVGQVLGALEEHGLSDNTIVLFTSDNGSPARNGRNMSGPVGSVVADYGHDPSRPWRGMKADIWEGGHRVPCIVRWPGAVSPGTVTDETICLTDFMATMAAIVGHALPEHAAEDSYNILPSLLGKSRDAPARPSIVHHSYDGTFAVREGDWKLVPGNLGSGGFTKPSQIEPQTGGPQGQLYDLADDPAETRNLWGERPDIVKRLSDLLNQIRQSGRSPAAR